MKKVYVVASVFSIEPKQREIKISPIDGLCGVAPIFKNKRKAKKFAGKGVVIQEWTDRV